MAIRALSRSYTCKDGVPTVGRVDTAIFSLRYFMRCMDCNFCHDRCCQYGVDVDAPTAARLLAEDELERRVGSPRSTWLLPDEWTEVPEYPGGRATRTRVVDGLCVFVNRSGRGCMVHTHCLENGRDYHELKPMMCSLFPITFDNGLLLASEEVCEGDLVCYGAGPTVYEGARDEVAFYFGHELALELDAMEREHATRDALVRSSRG